VASDSREQSAISGPKFRPANVAAQNLELVAEDRQLDVLDIRPTAAADEQAEQSSKSKVEEGNEHAIDPHTARPKTARPE
jgi:hypothetical protein